MPTGVGIWEKATSLGKEFKRGWFVGSVGAVSKGWGMLPLVFCCSARNMTGGLAQGVQSEREEGLLTADLVFWQAWHVV